MAASETDRQLATMERKLAAMYRQANKGVGEELKAYLAELAPKQKALSDAIKAAETPEEKAQAEKAYKTFLMDKTVNNGKFQRLSQQMADDLLKVNQQATQYVNGQMPDVYAKNYNEAGKDIKGQVKDYRFDMVDTSTVQRLAKSNDTLLPYKTVNGRKDVRWNTKAVNSEILQGINAGESIPKIAARLSNVTAMNAASAVRNARTATTSAQNRGRMDSYHKAQSQGIKLVKIWLATNDGRTRDAHYELNGQEREIDEPFENSIGPIMFPGDPNADPANVYNCRCTLVTKVVGFGEPVEPPEEPEEPEPQQVQPQQAPAQPFKSVKIEQALSKADYKEVTAKIQAAPTRSMYEKYADACQGINKMRSDGYYKPLLDTVHFSLSKMEGQDKFSVFAHEMAHMFDRHIGKHVGLNFNEIDTINGKCIIGSGARKLLKETPSNSDGFLAALRADMKALLPKLRDGSLAKEMRADAVSENASAGVQDALDGFYNTQKDRILRWGHGSAYYNRVYNHQVTGMGLDKQLQDAFQGLGFDASNQAKVKRLSRHYEAASEAWANVASAVTCGGAELEAVQKYMPETVKEFERICEVLK